VIVERANMATKREVEVWKGQVRMPRPLMDWVEARTKDSYRSLNAELVEVVREAKMADAARKSTQQ
jgi:hypothetical protein